MPINLLKEGRNVTITLEERFNFEIHREFRDVYAACQPSSAFIVDMKKVDYLDSSALGMLLLLREYAGGDKSNISIINCKSMVERIFKVANFDRLFKIV
ncbi:MAG: STAS domain-containing protein [Magnetococcales bacterium]|nr:STAS domain-containing protein [Magnetococcales bacterium]MBF0151838.1 STAS domain-containing protein [Magnetococcales bacterium]MBF0172008.1 STAS domain-containing protein [Magnetococcales bacterium]MBF0346611.1 STAS domain-containing protein [Magnetococcales bacterium]MBF0630590.1 STAS domain-containing protein [Magnetococcales bacterium]